MVRRLSREELPAAAELVKSVFDEFVAPDYPEEGVNTFYEFLETFAHRESPEGELVWGYEEDGVLAGILCGRGVNHISLLFVLPAYHKKGIARALFAELKKEAAAAEADEISVNASRYGIPAYEKLGFVAQSEEQMQNGILYTPMRYALRPSFALRPWRLDDAVLMQPYANNPKVAQNLRNGFPMPYTLDDARSFIESCVANDGNRRILRAIEIDGMPVGSIGVFLGSDVYEKTAEIGYWLAEPYWGRGIMPRAVRQICAQAFAQFDLECIYAEVFSCNPASCRVLEKVGFTREGIKRRGVYKNGRVMDGVLHTLLKDELNG